MKRTKNYTSISFENAIKIISYELTHSEGYKKVIIDLFGGEPFVEYMLIKRICEYTWDFQWPIEYMFWTTTNGTLLTSEMKEWLIKNKDKISCGLSLDGDKDVHNVNCSDSFDLIDVGFFVENWPERPVRAVVYPNTVAYICDSVKYLEKIFKKVKIRLAWGVDWDNEENDNILKDQLEKLVEHYIKYPEKEVCSLMLVDLLSVGKNDNKRQCCGVGANHVAYDTYGRRYPCAQFQSLHHDGKILIDDIDKINFGDREKYINDVCVKCDFIDVCCSCFAQCFTSKKEKPPICRTNKILLYYSIKLKIKKIEQNYQDTLINNDELRFYKSEFEKLKRIVSGSEINNE